MICTSLHKPRTRNEMAQNAQAEADRELTEHGVRVRAKRRSKNLPNVWWDDQRRPQRSWKNHRRTQYR